MPNKRIINLIISVILFFCVCSVSIACAEDGNGAGVGGKNKVSECIPNPVIEIGDGCGSMKKNIVIESCSKPEKATVEVKPEETCGRSKEEAKKCNKGEEKVVSPCKQEKPDEVTPNEPCKPGEKEDEHDVVSPEESGTGVGEVGVVSHGRSKDYDKVKIIPGANLSGEINLTIEKPPRYVSGNIVELVAGANITEQREATMGFEFTWKIYRNESFYLESIGKYRTVFLPYGDYAINLTVIDKKGRETSVGKVVTVVRVSGYYYPECGRFERRSRENVGCDRWRVSRFLLCYRYEEKKLEFVGVSWVSREGIVGQERLSRPKQCFMRKALSRIFGEDNNRNKNNTKVAFYAG